MHVVQRYELRVLVDMLLLLFVNFTLVPVGALVAKGIAVLVVAPV